MNRIINSVLAGSLFVVGSGMVQRIPENNLCVVYEVSANDESVLKDMDLMKENYIRFMCGDETSNQNASVQSKIKGVDEKAQKALDVFIPSDQDRSKGIFNGLDLTDREKSDAFSTTAKNLQAMGLAYKTPGSVYYMDEGVKEKILDGLQYYYDEFFNDEELMTKYFGNWYNWEIGIPTALSSLFVLMSDEIDHDLMKGYVACMDRYLQNGIDGDVDLTARQHTGANLADITMNRVFQGIVTQDAARIMKAISDMMTVYDVIDPNHIVNNNTDGVYEDGSFIQHHRVAYTGSYGVVLLSRISQSVIVLSGTQFQPQGHLEKMQEWIYNSFTPVSFEGYMMEIVKGRATSRTGTGYADMNKVLDAMMQVIPYMDAQSAQAYKEHIKYLVSSMPENIQPEATAFSLGSIATYEEIMADSSISPISHSSTGHYAFNSMDKNVHLRDDYAFSLSRSSNRIAKHEYMSGENKRSWFHGDGAFYLYLSGRDQTKSYGAEYYATVGAYNLPGTTVPKEERQTIQEWHGGKDYYDNAALGFESGSEKQNDYVYFPIGTNHYSGSVTLDNYAAAGMQLGDDNAYADKQKGLLPDDFVVYKNAEANKAWFMFDDEIVVMSSNIHDSQNRELMSTIDSRMADVDEQTSVEIGYKNGKQESLKENGTYKDVDWVHYGTNANGTNVGYYFLETKDMNIENGAKTGNLQDIRKQNPDKEVTHNVFTMTYDHAPNSEADSYSYVILPNADAQATKEYAANAQIKVLENNANVQAVEHKGLNMKGYMFYGQSKTDGIETSGSASVMMKQGEQGTTIAISDPTFEQSVIDVTLDMRDAVVVNGSDHISVESAGNKTILHVNVDKQNGKSFEVTLKEQDTTNLHETLNGLIDQASKLNKEEYTDASWKVLDTALVSAKQLDEKATVNELESAIQKLQAALDQLEKKSPKPVEPSKPEKPSKPNKKPGNTNTGVEVNYMPYIASAILAAIIGLFVFKKRK